MRIEGNSVQAVPPVAPAARAGPGEGQDVAAARAPAPHGAETTGRRQPAELEATLGKLGEELKSFDIALRFRRDEESGAIVIDLFDQATGEKVRQIPTEASLHLSKVLGRLKGVVVDLQA